jgi:SagB-type dehydrogenase family enzyme
MELTMKRSLAVLLLASTFLCAAQESIQLPPPQTEIGMPLMQALNLRQTSRSFDSKPLPLQELSNILWAADGINRPESGKRTAPSAMNWQEIDLYAVLRTGTYLYVAKGHSLSRVAGEDLRALAGTQNFVAIAPLNIVYVADSARTTKANDADRLLYTAADAGFIAQNVYLYCASQGFATVVRGSIDRTALAKALHLRSGQRIILAQTVGFPG